MAMDMNADLGESFGLYTIGEDEALLPIITSANVACGAHGGDPTVIDRTLRAARAAGVAVGAHPGFPDRQGFGRRRWELPQDQLEAEVAFQVSALLGMSARAGVTLRHVKPHGALYNMAWRESDPALAVARAVASVDASLMLVAPAGSELEKAGLGVDLTVVREAFADRAYAADGTLVPRSQPGALVQDPERAAERALQMAQEGRVQASHGEWLEIEAESLCVHSDTPGAARLAAAVRAALEQAGVTVSPMGSGTGGLATP